MLQLQPVALELQKRLQTTRSSKGNDTHDVSNVWYFGAGCIVAKHEELPSALNYLISDEVGSYVLHLNQAKWGVWWPGELPGDNQSAYPRCDVAEIFDGNPDSERATWLRRFY